MSDHNCPTCGAARIQCPYRGDHSLALRVGGGREAFVDVLFHPRAHNEIDELRAEVERLRAALTVARSEIGYHGIAGEHFSDCRAVRLRSLGKCDCGAAVVIAALDGHGR